MRPEGLGALALGGNRGPSLRHFAAVLVDLVAVGLAPVAVSAAYRTRAHRRPGQPPQADYWNAVCLLRPRWPAPRLLAWTEARQRAAGRGPAPPWTARPLDLDILLWGQGQWLGPRLVVPHPRLAQRRFVLAPLAELAPRWPLPGLGATPAALLARCLEPPDAVVAVRRGWWRAPSA